MFWQRDLCLAARGAPLRTILPPALSAVLRERWTALIQYLINRQRKDEGYRIAEERIQPDEEQYLQTMIDSNWEYMTQHWTPGNYQRGGNTKTHGVGSGEVTIRDDLPPQFRHDILADSRTYRAWVRFSGPGPDWPKDIDDIGFVSCSIKLMEVPGPKLLENEKFTQDLLSVCTHFAGSDDAVVVEPDADKPTRRRYWSCVPYLLGQGRR